MSREAVNARVQALALDWVEELSHELQDTTLELHQTAPRGGTNLNYYQQFRSAPGEPPAIEHGDLREAILNGRTVDTTVPVASVVVNTLYLETGTRYMAARPMGSMAVETLKMRHGES